jgi:hypothetical protein
VGAKIAERVHGTIKEIYMNKNSLNILGLAAALLIASTLFLSGCDMAAKNLAKQTVDAAKQMADLQDKAAEIEDKMVALSDKDRRTFQAELERLGVAAPEWLFADVAALMTGALEETEEVRGGILGFIGGLFGGSARSTDSSSSSGGSGGGGILGFIGGLFGGGSSRSSSARGSGNRPTPLAANATPQQAMAKLDEIIAYCAAHPSSSHNVTGEMSKQLKDSIAPFVGAMEIIWPTMSSTIIESINQTIAGLEGGGSTTAPTPSTTTPTTTASSSSGGTFTLTGIPSQYNGKYAYFAGAAQVGREAIVVVGVQSDNLTLDDKSVPLVPIRNGRVTLLLWQRYAQGYFRYTGNDTLTTTRFIITSQAAVDTDADIVIEVDRTFGNLSFRNGNATKAWRDSTISN